MKEKYSASDKIYSAAGLGEFSLMDLLAYFQEHGAMRVSDLHLKVGAPPTYRIDGNLVKLKGPPLTVEVAKKLIYPFVTEEKLKKLDILHSIGLITPVVHQLFGAQFR